MPEVANPVALSALGLVPCLVVFVVAAITRRTLEPLLLGILVGFLLLYQQTGSAAGGIAGIGHFAVEGLAAGLLAVFADEVIHWIVLVCGLFGSLIHVQTRTGGAEAIGTLLGRVVTGRRGVLGATSALGLAIFVDDYLNALTVGTTMRRLADRFGVSRAMLAYVVDSTAAPVCVLVPISTWALYIAGLLESEGYAAPGEGLAAYIGLLGTLIYPWVALALVLTVALTGWPLIGPMRGEERRAREAVEANADPESTESNGTLVWRQAATFVVPLVVLLATVFILPTEDGNRVVKGVLIGLLAAIVLGRLLVGAKLADLSEAAIEGFASMTPALAIVVLSFVLRDVNNDLRLTDYLVTTSQPWLNAQLLPAFAFLGLSLVAFTTGSFWGTYAIALPVVVPLAEQTGGSVPLAIGAVISAGAFGSHACFYGDATVLSSTSCGVPNMTHALTQLPYAALAATVTFIVYLIWGALI